MSTNANPGMNFGHEYYRKYIQEDENMRARLKALLNDVHEKRVRIKELHIEYAVKFCEVINSYRNRLDEIPNDYNGLINDLVSRREEILLLCRNATDKAARIG